MEIFVKITCINRTPVYYEHKFCPKEVQFRQIIMVEKNLQYFANLQQVQKCNNLQIFAHTEIAKFCKCAKSCNILQICNKYKNAIICTHKNCQIL
jgi:hypothetical protein